MDRRMRIESEKDPRKTFLRPFTSRKLLLLNAILSVAYLLILILGFVPSNKVLFYILIFGELFHVYQILGYELTLYAKPKFHNLDRTFKPLVNVFITVCGEPIDIVRNTALAARDMKYPNLKVYILNDGYVANKKNWRKIEKMAGDIGIECITRRKAGGAKAGNINNALAEVSQGDFFAVFDADHIPHDDFLIKTVGYFADENIGFVQTPQYYRNFSKNSITETAWSQQALFFGPIMRGKSNFNSAFMCGTNMVIRKKAIIEAGGMCEYNIAEDFLTSLFIHKRGYNSIYIPEVLAEGLAPEDFMSYYKQQFRWARGSLEVIFKYNPLFLRGLKFRQRIQYLVSASYFLTGLITIFDLSLPLIFLFFGIVPVVNSSMTLAIIFLPYIFMTLMILQLSSNFSITYNTLAYGISSFYIQLSAIFGVIFNRKASFSVTSKTALSGNFSRLVWPQIMYISLSFAGLIYGYLKYGFGASYMANATWIILNSAVFYPFIKAALGPSPLRKSLARLKTRNSDISASDKEFGLKEAGETSS